jgi:phage terminase large subunit
MSKPTLNPNLREFWNTRVLPNGEPVRFRVLHGGRMSSKSHDMAGMAIARANFKEERILCLRMYQNRIADSVYTLLKDKISYFGLESEFKIFADAIEHKTNGSLFRFYGLARNVDEVKSFEGATVAWFEESHNLTENMFTIVRPTIMRNAGAEMWFAFNPRTVNDYSWKRLVRNPPKGALVHQINYGDNQFLSVDALNDIAAEFDEDYEFAQHTYDGVPLEDDDSVLIKRSWIMSAIDAHKKITPGSGSWFGGKVIGYDVADSGSDKNATTGMDGSVCVHLDEWKAGEDELFESAKRVVGNAKLIGASSIGYDSIGVGAGTGAHLDNMTPPWRKRFRFNADGKVVKPNAIYGTTKIKNLDLFCNIKAQKWWRTADRFRNTHVAVTKGKMFDVDDMISLSSDDINPKMLDELVDELSTPRRDFDTGGKVKVESKKDLKKREVPSPDKADSFIIANSGMLTQPLLSDWV